MAGREGAPESVARGTEKMPQLSAERRAPRSQEKGPHPKGVPGRLRQPPKELRKPRVSRRSAPLRGARRNA